MEEASAGVQSDVFQGGKKMKRNKKPRPSVLLPQNKRLRAAGGPCVLLPPPPNAPLRIPQVQRPLFILLQRPAEAERMKS